MVRNNICFIFHTLSMDIQFAINRLRTTIYHVTVTDLVYNFLSPPAMATQALSLIPSLHCSWRANITDLAEVGFRGRPNAV